MKQYDLAELELKDALAEVKKAGHSSSLGYCYLMTRLAHTCYLSRKYSDALKFFKVSAEVMPIATKNPANIFQARMNLLLMMTYHNIEQASMYAERLMIDDNLPAH
jgi:hypothetical protein